MLFKNTFINLVVAALAVAGPPNLSRQEPVTDLVTFCFSEGDCFQGGVDPDVGCVDLPEFSEPVETASLSSTGVECLLSPEPSCQGSGLPAILLPTAGTVEISTLGLSNVASYLCTSDVDIVNLCFPEVAEGCFQASTVTDGCATLTLFSEAYASLFLTTNGTECTFFQDGECAGPSAFVNEAGVTFELDTLGINNVKSLSCTNTQTPPPPRR
ncbi:hypothetical protein BDP27DRAFT_1454661 [Rhodocollybia butyracea]|uniref:Uncharacterized protein n=2 Tax=Rhodocollybia butyracea TaxID=206335 RepID=A0A9P5P6K3_9AGAR|nr:hypothetical protein BDP27DRAFT_1454661 [Rhodocollybia butyracea]